MTFFVICLHMYIKHGISINYKTHFLSLPFFRGCLFYGPPGTGKTLVARALANECSQGDKKVSFFMRKGADCLSKWVGESERQLRLLFDQVSQCFGKAKSKFNILATITCLIYSQFGNRKLVVFCLNGVSCVLPIVTYFSLFWLTEMSKMFLWPDLTHIFLFRRTWWGHPLFSSMRLMVWLPFAPAGKTRYTGETNVV